jgi:hypothetical protein
MIPGTIATAAHELMPRDCRPGAGILVASCFESYLSGLDPKL